MKFKNICTIKFFAEKKKGKNVRKKKEKKVDLKIKIK
jgi:hypothetical protein